VLSRLHATLEILLLAESEMKFSVSSLQPLAAFCLNNIEASVSKIYCPMRVGIFMIVKILIFFFCVITLYSLVHGYRHCGGTCHLHSYCPDLAYFCPEDGSMMLEPTFRTPWLIRQKAT